MTRRTLALATILLALTASAATAQTVEESRMLRDAAARESRGDLAGAEEVLRRLLASSPTSSGGLFALERVLRANGTVRALLPVADTFLAHAPDSPGVRYLKLRVLTEVDSLDAVREEAGRWFEADPSSESPYREVARVYERAFGPDEALEVLRRGREATDDAAAFALEMGDLHAARGDVDAAVGEWARAVGDDGAQASTVARRVSALESDRDEAARGLVAALARARAPGRRRAGATVALDLGLEVEAFGLARRVAGELDGRQRASFLADVARRARDGGMADLAGWAYEELGDEAGTPGERRQFDQRLVEVSLAAGDTLAALEAQRRVAASYSSHSVDRRRALARVIGLESGFSGPTRLQALLLDFREEFPEAPELDDLAATVAAGFLGRGDPQGAAAVLEGIDGPKSNLERGYLLLADGDLALGRQALLLAVPGLNPSEATEIIQFAGLLGRLAPGVASLLAEAWVMEHRGDGEEAVGLLERGADAIEQKESRASLLAEAARLSERGGNEARAAELRRRIVSEHPDAPERSAAALELARYTARVPGGVAEAIRILEELITRRPNAAVVPDARRELERLRGSAP